MRLKKYGILAVVLLLLALAGCSKSYQRTTKEIETTTYGIDVARYQGTIDWEFVSRCGEVDFAMVRTGYRGNSDGTIKEDSNARYNLQEGAKFDLPLGVYFFSTAITEEEAVEEAEWVANLIAPYPITYPVAYDCEGFRDPDSRQYSLTKTERTDIALAFLKRIEELGYEGMFYGAKNEIQDDTLWETSRIEEDYKIWVAQYPGDADPEVHVSSYTGNHAMWQYTMEGQIPGISQNVDRNVAYFGYDGIEPPHDATTPEEVGPDIEAMMDFTLVNEVVTAKVETNLRDIPSQDGTSTVLYTLKNGETATRVAISSSGWSKLEYQGQTVYAVSNYLTTDMNYDPAAVEPTQAVDTDGDGIVTTFTTVSEKVTAKEYVNLRKLPSVEHEDAEVVCQLHNGEVAIRTGINEDLGWSRVEFNGQVLYCVSSYLTLVEE